eukprot:g19742.t1
MAVALSTPSSVPSEIMSFLRKFGTRIYSASDVSRAFARIVVDIELARWLSVLIGDETMMLLRGVLGFSPFPAIFSQIMYPVYNGCKVSEQAVEEFARQAYAAMMADRANGVQNPLRGFLGRHFA